MKDFNKRNDSIVLPNPITQVASMPYALYLSLQGKYFVGYADDMKFDSRNIAWAGLINPIHSGVNLYVYVWTVTNIGKSPLNARIYFNIDPAGQVVESAFVTPANTALYPLPKPKIKLLQANNVLVEPKNVDSLITREVLPEVTIVGEEEGTFIFPPGGSFIITLSNSKTRNQIGEGRVAFGWYEEKVNSSKKQEVF